jgi:hypothetical protein
MTGRSVGGRSDAVDLDPAIAGQFTHAEWEFV